MAGTVGGIAGATYRTFTIISCMPTEAALVDASILGAVEREAAMLKFIYSINGFTCENLRRRLIYEVVTTLHGIIHMPLPMVLFLIAKCSCHATLCRTSM
jgi:hypothetical protein